MSTTDTERDERLRGAIATADFWWGRGYRNSAIVTLAEEVARLDAVVTAVRDLHRVQWDHCQGCYDSTGRLVAYPCPTVRALDGVL